MKHIYRSVRLFFIKNYGAIKLGLLVGLLVTNLILLNNQSKTLSEVLKISEQLKGNIKIIDAERKDARDQSERRDNIIIQYLRCIALILPQNRTEENINQCVNDAKLTPAQQEIQNQSTRATVPSNQNQPEPTRNQPTTSAPPDSNKGFVQRMNETVENIGRSIDKLITGGK